MAVQIFQQLIMPIINEFRDVNFERAVKIILLLVVCELGLSVENVFIRWAMLNIITAVILGLELGSNWFFTKSPYILLLQLILLIICITLTSILGYLSCTLEIIMTIEEQIDN
ncbi:uncharacterized protein LOC123262513 [Cotesia glomerata]|uniref:uncharacterized protein LOC123262513 n=1 Tax=Cotesia glomerata TaxID=32391 RepID=UPI001D0198EC|nr:uncharacterized protein LOC123262513 [Cotesia glomerata]